MATSCSRSVSAKPAGPPGSFSCHSTAAQIHLDSTDIRIGSNAGVQIVGAPKLRHCELTLSSGMKKTSEIVMDRGPIQYGIVGPEQVRAIGVNSTVCLIGVSPSQRQSGL